jgi:hypothetical protein
MRFLKEDIAIKILNYWKPILIGLELPFSNFINDIYDLEIRKKNDKFEIWVMARAAYEEELLDALPILGMKAEIDNFNWQTGDEFVS